MALAGKRAVVFGVCNKWSLAWACAQSWHAAGAQLTLVCKSDREKGAVEQLASSLSSPLGTGTSQINENDAGRYSGLVNFGDCDGGAVSLVEETETLVCDVSDEAAIQAVFARASHNGARPVHCVLHAVAAAPPGALAAPLFEASKEDFLSTQLISAYSLISIARAALPVMEASLLDGQEEAAQVSSSSSCSITSLTYIGASRAVPGYGIMGAAKASLESSTRYLAHELGPRGVRVNCLSAPPLNTLSARGIPGFKDMHRAAEERSFSAKAVTHAQVAEVATFLASDAACSITGQVVHADAGFGVSAF